MPRSYASDLLADDIDLDGERLAGRPMPSGGRRSDLFMVLIAGAASAAVLFNALGMQGGRREASATAIPKSAIAPTSAAPTSAPAAARPAPSAPVRAPAAEAPVLLVPVAPLPPVKPAAPPPRAAVPPVAVQPVAVSAPGISSLVANGAGGTMRPPADIAVSPRVMDVQKALAKLGYGPIRIDGKGGTATAEAIQRFERDRKLPVTGEISDRVVRELNAVAGLSIQ